MKNKKSKNRNFNTVLEHKGEISLKTQTIQSKKIYTRKRKHRKG